MKRLKELTRFTLVELLIVISVIILLISLLLPALGKAKQQVQKTSCANSIRQVGVGFMMYTADWSDYLPPFRDYEPVNEKTWYSGSETRGYIAQYLKLNDIYTSIGMAGINAGKMRKSKFRCPTVPDLTSLTYSFGYNVHVYGASRKLSRFTTPSETCLLADCQEAGPAAVNRWTTGSQIWPIVGRHLGTANIVFSDFHVASKKFIEIPLTQSTFWYSE